MKKISKELLKVKALIIEDFKSGEIKTYYNKNEFEELLSRYTENEITRVFEITDKIRETVLELLIKSMKVDSEGGATVEINSIEMISKIFPIITDMDFTIDLEEDIQYISELIENPTEWMEEVSGVVIPRIAKLTKELEKDLDKFNALPKEQQQRIIKETEKLLSEKQLQEVEDDINKLKDNIEVI